MIMDIKNLLISKAKEIGVKVSPAQAEQFQIYLDLLLEQGLLTEEELTFLYDLLNISQREEIPDAIIRAVYGSVADIVILQMQDILKLGNEARMNSSGH